MKKFIKNIFKSKNSIIIISFLINIVLLIFLNNSFRSNKIYSFNGSGDYIKVIDGLVTLNNDVNIINGNNIIYTSNIDYDIKYYKIGYYVMNENKLTEIISNKVELNETIKLSDAVNKFTNLNIVEKDMDDTYFTNNKKRLIDKGLYLILEAKTEDGNEIFDKIQVNMSKISKY